jgi:hypothetical protein
MKTIITSNKITLEINIKDLAKQFYKINKDYKITDNVKFAEAFLNYVEFGEFDILNEIVELEGDEIENWAELKNE